MLVKPLRGMIVEVALDPTVGHEQGRTRPCIVVQNDVGNRFASTTIVVPVTDARHVKMLSEIYVPLPKGDGGLTKDSCALCDQIRTVDQRRFGRILGTLSPESLQRVDRGLLLSLGLADV